MTMKLIVKNGPFPPGGHLFKDLRTGLVFEHGTFDDVTNQIQKHRMANPKVYPASEPQLLDLHYIAIEQEKFTCMRLNNDARYCESGEPIPINTQGMDLMTMSAPCPKCGCTTGWQVICRTCAGKKRTGFYCENCKNLCPR
jgi:hypothetical protein